MDAPSFTFGSLLPFAGTDFSPTSVIQTKQITLFPSIFSIFSHFILVSFLFTSLRIHFPTSFFLSFEIPLSSILSLVVFTTYFTKLNFYVSCFFSSFFSVSRFLFSSLLIPLPFFRLFYSYSLITYQSFYFLVAFRSFPQFLLSLVR